MRIQSNGGALTPFGRRNTLSFAVAVVSSIVCLLCARPALASDAVGATEIKTFGIFTADLASWRRTDTQLPLKTTTSLLDFASFPPVLEGRDEEGPKSPSSASVDDRSSAETAGEAGEDSEIFGTVSIAVSHLAIERRWRSIAPILPKAVFGSTCVGDRALCDSPLMHVWSRLQVSIAVHATSRLDILRRVNAEVNSAIRYRSDEENYGVPDYWASPVEVARRGSGDCKEFALTKMWMLAALDIPNSSMRIVVVRDTRSGVGHAILNVTVDGANFILDNLTSQIRADHAVNWYQPLYSVNATGSWVHGLRRATAVSRAETRSQLADAHTVDASDDLSSN